MNNSPAISQRIRCATVEIKPFIAILQCGHHIMLAIHQQIDGFSTQLLGVISVETDGPTTTLRVTDFSNENGCVG
jgi:hypothetical protein